MKEEITEKMFSHKNVICQIKIGDSVMIDKEWGANLGGKTGKVLDVKYCRNCGSGFMIYTDITDRPLDSGWFTLLNSDKYVQECDTTKVQSDEEPLAHNSFKEALEKEAESIGNFFKQSGISRKQIAKRSFGNGAEWAKEWDKANIVADYMITISQLRQEIESLRSVRNTYNELNSRLMEDLRTANQTIAELKSAPVDGMRWVKASERLPKKRHNYFVKMLSFRSDTQYIFNATCLFDGESFVDDINCNLLRHGNTVVEWLEESASPAVKDNWIPVEQKPKKSGCYLVYDENTFGDSKIEIYFYKAHNDSWVWGADYYHPQYWQELPEQPKK
jgi:hypothetical protein